MLMICYADRQLIREAQHYIYIGEQNLEMQFQYL